MSHKHETVKSGDLKKLQALLEDDPNLVFSKDDFGHTPLHLAVFGGHKDVVVLLLANKSDVNAKDDSGMTPLGWATKQGHNELADLLRQHGGHE
jgi:ankyrin repeat protein